MASFYKVHAASFRIDVNVRMTLSSDSLLTVKEIISSRIVYNYEIGPQFSTISPLSA